MNHSYRDLVILGGGLTGLTLAYRLRDSGYSITVLEAQERLGGRIYTLYPEQGPPVEMGATWLGQKHSALWSLLEELGLPVFEQRRDEGVIFEAGPNEPLQQLRLPPEDAPTYRIAGGSSILIKALAEKLRGTEIHLQRPVSGLQQTLDGIVVSTAGGPITAGVVVSTLPPDLLLRTVCFDPALPPELVNLAQRTDTWMGKSIKVALTYPEPFWRRNGHSATFFSNAGPVTELYDHGDAEDKGYALKGFLDPTFLRLDRQQRREKVLGQLTRYYGPNIRNYLAYYDMPWAEETYTTASTAADLLPHQLQGHPLYHQARWGGRLYLAGTETAEQYPGYMEGAVRSAEALVRAIAQ
ncbi:flavin monoamine oxidase family protein [Neolewinella litorea]|uniref:FAD-dependent oxidoreductase n=1 Tax=Neolewinella litorea TaxID=2562452 RepID=A0A4S4NUC6_9BACT|nr:NAD(P)/FAD-dependent oxidoreductase [Neolewinella litorea]THH42078.1 FAD-dependent oxidoreductase [Neolewinella litorea]